VIDSIYAVRQARKNSKPPYRREVRLATRAVLERLEERALLSTYSVSTTADSGAGSLRQAILDANNHVNGYSPLIRDVISFDTTVFGGGVKTIACSSALPAVTDSVTIDGTLASGKPGVQLDGSAAGIGVDGLDIYGGNTLVRGLIISNFNGNGIVIAQSGGDVIHGNYIGTDLAGTGWGGNGIDGIAILAGGDAQVLGNVIGDNGGNGIEIRGGSGDTIKANFIGVDASGRGSMGNAGKGIVLSGAANVTIGGGVAGDGNVIAANAGDGVQVRDGSSAITIQGNFIGTNSAADATVGNGGNGVNVLGASHDITVSGNILSGNGASGVQLSGTGGNITIQGNRIGTDAGGSLAVSNSGDGVYVNGACHALIAGNVISGNSVNGIDIAWSGIATVQGNDIGLAADGTTALGNGGAGVYISGSGNLIGGSAAQGNAIAFNGENGVTLLLTASANTIRGNSIFSNTLLGIDLGNNGVTLNDAAGHVGPNNYQDFPVIASVVNNNDGTVTVIGTITSQAAGSFLLDFYANNALNASTYGEGRTYLGGVSVNVNAAGTSSFTVTLTAAIPAGQMWVTGTATDGAGNTSEFSRGVQATQGQPLLATTTTLASSTGSSIFGKAVTFTATVSHGTLATGTVDFIDLMEDGSVVVLGSSAIDANGVATFSTSSLSMGTHTIHAVYHGDTHNAGSASSDLDDAVRTNKVTIGGHTYSDTTGNGISTDDTPLTGVTVNLYQDTNGNGKIDTGDVLLATAVTGADGKYEFSNLNAGTYIVQEITPPGSICTAPVMTSAYAIHGAEGSVFSTADFDNYRKGGRKTDVSSITYTVIDPKTGTHTYSDLRGHTAPGDTVIVKFTVRGNSPIALTLVSYTAPSGKFVAREAAKQQVFQFATGTFAPGAHTLTVTLPKHAYQVDFVMGSLINQFGPAGGNVFYSAQDRLLGHDNGG
jgi:parallel beta-helix repeat protein